MPYLGRFGPAVSAGLFRPGTIQPIFGWVVSALETLLEIKGFSQCIAANKQKWCGLVAAASCGIVAACEFFVCKLVLLLLVAATLRLLVAATLQLLVAATLRLLVAATLQLFVCRECVGLVVDCF